MKTIERLALFVTASALLCASALAAETSIYLSPLGDDHSNGMSASSAVKTFERAVQLATPLGTHGDVAIRFLQGDYGDATMRVAWPNGAVSRLTLVADGERGKVVFDGRGSGKTWLQIVGMPSPASNVAVSGFVVRHYRQAIQFVGDRFAGEPSLTNNLVENNVFEYIGQFKAGVEPALAAVHMLNTSRTTIRGNVFREVRNLNRCDGLHSIYMAGGASDNTIVDNVFDGGCGDTIKVRDRANFNLVERNTFKHQSGRSLFVDSFCDLRRQPECRGPRQECPSWGNVFRGNQVDEESRAAVRFIQHYVGASSVPGCPPPSGGSSTPRIIASY